MACESIEENVVNLIEKPKKEYIKSPRYRSIHSKRTRDELARAKHSHRTLGPAQTPLSPPSCFLKKGEGPQARRPKSMHVHYRPPGYIRQLPEWQKRPRSASPGPIPPFPTDPVCLARTDFKKKNVKQVAQWARKPDRPRFVDTVKGDAHELLPSGLMPRYIYKKNFGEFPPHLKRKPIAGAPAHDKRKSRPEEDYQRAKKSACRYVTEDERAKILEDMTKKWLELMKTFQCLPFLIDTPPKIKRKAALEDQLKSLEKDIQLIESHKYIYVYDDKKIKKSNGNLHRNCG